MSKTKFETVEEAVKHIAELTSAHNNEVKSLKDLLAEYPAKIKELEKERDEAIAHREAALGEVGSLSEQLELKSQSRPGAEVIKIGNKNYTLHGKAFNIPGFSRMTVEELSKNKEALAYLVDKKSGVLVEAKGSK